MFSFTKTTYWVFIFVCATGMQNLSAQSEDELLDQLQADYEAWIDASSDFEKGVHNGSISGTEMADYGVWVDQLEAQFNESCRTFSAYSSRAVPVDIPCTEFTATYFKPLDIDFENETTDGEKTAAISDQFYDSLGDFDEKLLTEQDRVKSQKPRVESDSASAGGGGESAGDSSGSDSEQGAQSGAQSEADGSDESGDIPSQGSESASSTGLPSGGSPGSQSPTGNSNIPDDIPDGSDDDVIARQLREAAEKETDPELREKLWEEYRRYKSGS